MLAQKLVEIDERIDRIVLLELADRAGGADAFLYDGFEFFTREQCPRIADRRVGRYAAPELRLAALIDPDLAHQVHLGNRAVALLLGERREVQ